MSTANELVAAISKRIAAGVPKEEIKSETVAAGHKEDIFEAAYTLASSPEYSEEVIPSSRELFLRGIAFIRKEWKFALLLGLPLVFISVAELTTVWYEDQAAVITGSSIVGIVALLAYAFLVLISLHAVTQTTDEVEYKQSITWAKQHIWAAIGVYFLMILVIWGGFVLFILPGIILSLSLYFSLFALVNQNLRGEAALQYSRRLVHGRWWLVARKIVGIGLYNLLIILGFIILGDILEDIMFETTGQTWFENIFIVLGQFVGAAISLSTLYAGNQLYQALDKRTTEVELSKTPYRIIGAVGLLAFLALALLIGYLLTSEEGRKLLTSTTETTDARAELMGASFTATAYKFTNDGSYEGVCEVLQSGLLSTEGVVCNDDASAWAIAVTRNEVTWCVDSTDYRKRLEAPLEERTKCLPL